MLARKAEMMFPHLHTAINFDFFHHLDAHLLLTDVEGEKTR
jgi:hypothetical protein